MNLIVAMQRTALLVRTSVGFLILFLAWNRTSDYNECTSIKMDLQKILVTF
jgi:hypothetical protein